MKKLLLILLYLPMIGFGQEVKRAYYNSGAILSEVHYNIEGKRDGTTKYFYDWGAWAIKTEANYKNGKMEGEFTSYTKYGRIKEEGFYKYTEEGVCSERTGIWKRYYDSGELNSEITYDENGKSVKYISYEKDGTIIPMLEGGC
jgi:antitoxin component YwqK of YwqJK toxin-antitoxin module